MIVLLGPTFRGLVFIVNVLYEAIYKTLDFSYSQLSDRGIIALDFIF